MVSCSCRGSDIGFQYSSMWFPPANKPQPQLIPRPFLASEGTGIPLKGVLSSIADSRPDCDSGSISQTTQEQRQRETSRKSFPVAQGGHVSKSIIYIIYIYILDKFSGIHMLRGEAHDTEFLACP